MKQDAAFHSALAVRERYRDDYWRKHDPIAADRLLWRAQAFRHIVHLLPGHISAYGSPPAGPDYSRARLRRRSLHARAPAGLPGRKPDHNGDFQERVVTEGLGQGCPLGGPTDERRERRRDRGWDGSGVARAASWRGCRFRKRRWRRNGSWTAHRWRWRAESAVHRCPWSRRSWRRAPECLPGYGR